MSTPEVQRMIHQAAAAAMEGAVDQLSSEDESARLARLASEVAVVLSRALGEVVKEQIIEGPDYRAALRTFQDGVAGATTIATRAAIRTAAEEIPRSLGPSIGDSLATELESPRLRSVLAGVVEDVARTAVSGAQRGIIDVREGKRASGVPTITERIGRLLVIASVVAFVLGAGFIALLAWILRRHRRAKEYHTAMVGFIPSRLERKSVKPEWTHHVRSAHALAR
jgi:hypothetical protein